MTSVKNSIATSFNHFNFIIQTFNKTTALTLDKIVGNFLHPFL